MGDTVGSFLMGQAAADLLNSLKARFEDARNDAEIRSLMYQMRDAYERHIAALKKNIEIYRHDLEVVTRSRNKMTESREIAVKTAEKAVLKIRELRATRDELIQKNSDIETQKAKLIEENNALKLQLKKSLAEASTQPDASEDLVSKIERLWALKKTGAISAEEFNAAKTKLISS